jgi:Tol biopolymer transport system component
MGGMQMGTPEATPGTGEGERLAGLIVFAEDGRIGLTHPATRRSAFISSGPGDYSPVWSPDGTMIAFTRFFPVEEAGTYVMRMDGSGVTKVSDIANLYNLPVWSPDGTRLSIINRRPGPEMGLWVVMADGSGEPVHVYPARGPMQHVAWSPNSDKIAFTYNMATHGDGLFLVPADGSAEAQIVVDSETGTTLDASQKYLTRAGSLAWSPNGRYIAVRSYPLAPRGVESPMAANEPILQIVRVGDDDSVRVVHTLKGMAKGEWYPAFAPNGLTIAVVTQAEDGMEQLSVVSLTSGEAVHLHMGERFGSPSWSPDGGRILVTAYSDEDPEGVLQMLQLADIGMEWNMAMDMTMDMEAASVTELRSGFQALWAPTADVDMLPNGSVQAAAEPSSIRIAGFTFDKYS